MFTLGVSFVIGFGGDIVKSLKIYKAREHRGCEAPSVVVKPIRAGLVDVTYGELVMTPDGVMRLASLRLINGSNLTDVGMRGDVGIQVGADNVNSGVVSIGDKLFARGRTSDGVEYYRKVDGVGYCALYEVVAVNPDVIVDANEEIIKRYNF
jgi:hypothetical protein